MAKEKILNVIFQPTPEVGVRVIDADDTESFIKHKKKYPFELEKQVRVLVETTKREFKFFIPTGYVWNGADIPRFLWRLIGSRTDNDFLIASMVHDYLLEFKTYILCEVLQNQLSKKEYRRLTSLIFRHIIKKQGTNTVKANIMAYCVDVFQMFNFKGWK